MWFSGDFFYNNADSNIKTHSKAYILVPVYEKVYYSECPKKEER